MFRGRSKGKKNGTQQCRFKVGPRHLGGRTRVTPEKPKKRNERLVACLQVRRETEKQRLKEGAL